MTRTQDLSTNPHWRHVNGIVERLRARVEELTSEVSRRKPGPLRESYERELTRKRTELKRFEAAQKRIEEDVSSRAVAAYA